MEDVTAPLAGPLADALARGRETINARLAMARRGDPALDPVSFAAFVRGIDPIVAAVHRRDRAAVDRVTMALCDAGLRLVSLGLAGTRSRQPGFEASWRSILEAAPHLLAEDASRLAAAVANALLYLAQWPGARRGEWTAVMAALAPGASTVDQLLDAGKVAAWREGLAHTRAAALDVCAALPPELAARALGLPGAEPESVARALEALRSDRWVRPSHPPPAGPRKPKLLIGKPVGGFRGFGYGPFMAPPRVSRRGEAFVLTDGRSAWELHADACGATLVPTRGEPGAHAHGAITLAPDGEVRHRDEPLSMLPMMAGASSWASDDRTLVATFAHTHRAIVFGVSENVA